MNQIMLNIEDACDIIMEFSNGKELYVSLDIDVVDPAFAPATGYANEAGGLTSRQILYLIQRINKIKNLRAVDIVEINEKLDSDLRNTMNGHDFIEILFLYINKIKNSIGFKLVNFERAFLLSMQPDYFDEYPLFELIAAK